MARSPEKRRASQTLDLGYHDTVVPGAHPGMPPT